ncbi:MAG: ABC transporter ATP-binding protein [Chloroflexota bacterium]
MTAAPAGPALVLDAVVKRYGPRRVLDGLTMSVDPGELVALLGPNGAGKTTAVEMLEGYRTPDGGTVRVLGEDPRRGGPALKARVGVMLQDGGLDPRSTPHDVLRLYAALHKGSKAPDGLLELVGLDRVSRTRVRRLSGGERQRLALAVALIGDPEVLILDEPTAGMDPEARRATRGLISGLRAEGCAILLTTHDLADVERMADRVVILHGGKIVANGAPADLAAGAGQGLRLRLGRVLTGAEFATFGAALSGAIPGATLIAELEEATGAFRVDGVAPDPMLVVAAAAWCADSGIQIVELRAAAATLEERYLALTGDQAVESVP